MHMGLSCHMHSGDYSWHCTRDKLQGKLHFVPSLSEIFCIFNLPPFFRVCVHIVHQQRDLKREEAARVWDLDTTLPCPVILDVYATEALRPWVALRSEFTRWVPP